MSAAKEYRPTIGLEIHAELDTHTKMFCSSKNDPDETRPNVNICPVCLAHPGTLPTINAQAIRHVLRVGTAIGGKLADYTEFDRKNYFYPDIPKGYQISQYEHPLVSGGALLGVAVTRIHLEEDTARSTHHAARGATQTSPEADGKSLVDFNRAGVPLMELVTEPDMHDAKTAGEFARELQLLLRTLGVSHANLEKGEMRVEANVSVSATDTPSIAYVEVKNLNSFRSVERAIAFEIERQTALLERGEKLVKETRGWDESRQKTFSQRVKEGAADYRYFPEPDLPKLILSELPGADLDSIRATLPELPWERRTRYGTHGLKAEDAAYIAGTPERGLFFDKVLTLCDNDDALTLLATNYLISDLAGYYAKNDGIEYEHVTPESFVTLMRMIATNELSSRGAKEVLLVLAEKGGDPKAISSALGLGQVSDPEALRKVLGDVLIEHAAVAAEYQAGKESVLQFLVGQGMKATQGAGNPTVIRELLIEELQK